MKIFKLSEQIKEVSFVRYSLVVFLLFCGISDGVTFLTIAPGARAIGMGGAFVAIADDATACYYNPAGLAFINQPQFLSMNLAPPPGIAKGLLWSFKELPYLILGQDERPTVDPEYFSEFARIIYGATVTPLDNKQSIGIGTHYWTTSSIDVRNQDGEYLGSYHLYDVAFGISYGRRLIKPLGVGITIKYLHDFLYPQWVADLYDLSGPGSITSYAVDGGVLLKAPFGLSIGASLLNVGPNVEYYDTTVELPLTGRIGTALSFTDLLDKLSKNNEHSILQRINRWFDIQLAIDRRFDLAEEEPYHKTTWGLEVQALDVLSYRQGWTLAGSGLYIMENPKSFGVDLGMLELDVTVTNSDYPLGIWWMQTKFSPLETKPEFIQQNETLDRIFLNLSCAAIPGGGQLYNGDAWKGIPLVIASLFVADAVLERDVRPDWEYTAALISLPILYIGSGIEANMSWRR